MLERRNSLDTIALESFILYNNVRLNPIVKYAVQLLSMAQGSQDRKEKETLFYEIQRGLLSASDYMDLKGTYWGNYICKLIAESENRFSLTSEKGNADIDQNVKLIAIREMEILRKLYSIDWKKIEADLSDGEISVCRMEEQHDQTTSFHYRHEIRAALERDDVNQTLTDLERYYYRHGCGIFENYEAFVWDKGLVGIRNYDKITFEQLVGYETQKKALIENTEFFLNGLSCNNALLHGDRGTGKSSSVKALLNRFADRKLKLISINKHHIDQLYGIIESIGNRGCKFIIFIDDLSFEDTEVGYKHFKSIIDGGIEAQPKNILIYVTSNRRHIIKETWKDRGDNGEVHGNDGMQERLSLSDRFGLTIPFISPDREGFFQIVKGIVKQEGIDIDEIYLLEEAVKWDMRQKGRSGRVARQFVNHVSSKLLLNQIKEESQDDAIY